MQSIYLHIVNVSKGRAPSPWLAGYFHYLQRVYYIKSGKGNICMENGTRIPFVPNSFYIMPANLHLEFETDPQDPIDHLYFDFFSTPPILSDMPIRYPVKQDSLLAALIPLIDKALHDRKDDTYSHPKNFSNIYDAPAGSPEETKQIIHNLLQLTLQCLSNERPIPFVEDAMVLDTVNYIKNHYAEPLSLDVLAKRANFHKIYFLRRFKQVMNVTPYAYLRTYRLLRARELLAAGETMATVAEQVGYQNASSLYHELRTSGFLTAKDMQ